MSRRVFLPILFFSFLNLPVWGDTSVLSPVKTDHPRDTMQSFITAMQNYKEGLESDNPELTAQIDKAVRTLNLTNVPFVVREEKGRQAAILLKEVIDRVILIDYSKIPTDQSLNRWRLKNTEIVISRVQEGERAGEFLFAPETIERAREFYSKVENLPYLPGSGKGAGYNKPWQEKLIPEWGREIFFGLQKWQWIGIFIAILTGLVVRFITEKLVHLAKFLVSSLKENLKESIHAIEKPLGLLAAGLFWLACLYILKLDDLPLAILLGAVQIVIGISLIWAAYKLSGVLTNYLNAMAQTTETDLDDQMVPLLAKSLRVFIVVFGTLILAQNLGLNVMSLLAGLGLGGLAFALAARDTAANLFGSIMILFDRPFKAGDWIKTSSVEGTVEEVGFRSTRIRTFWDSQISIPNSVLANESIDNMGRRTYRRTLTTLGVTYDTPPEKLEAFLEGIKNIILANEFTRKDYFNVVFSGYGASSLEVLVHFFLDVPGYSEELVERQNIYLEIYRLAESLGIEFAFPTQTLHVETFPEKQGAVKRTQVSTEELAEQARAYGPQGQFSKPKGLGLFVPPFKN